jgi:hypothetical protein
MTRRRGAAIGFVLVSAVSLFFAVAAGHKIATILKDLPLAHTRPWTGEFFRDSIFPPRNFPPNQQALLFVAAPIGLSLAAGLLFAHLWQYRSGAWWLNVAWVICFGALLALSGINFGWDPEMNKNTAIEVWVSGTMTLIGLLLVILAALSSPRTRTEKQVEFNSGFVGVALLLFQGVLLPACTAVVMGIDTLGTEKILINGWSLVTVVALIASIWLAIVFMNGRTPLQDRRA